jgi:hypothetical protein
VTTSRGDLDLGDLLRSDVTHYRDVLEGKEPSRPPHIGEERRGIQAATPGRSLVIVPDVERFGEGLPDLASSCTELEISPLICWDVCGYYAALGVPWTASRRELVDAYTRCGGPDSEHLTYVLKQLLREGGQLRRRYDRAPLGELFKEDKDVELYLLRLAIKLGRARGASQEDMLREWGLAYQQRARADEGLEGPRQKGINFDSDRPEASDPITNAEWWLEDWGWYGLNLWVVPVRAGEILAEWQRLLAAEFSARGMRVRFAVGLGSASGEHSGHTLHIGPNGSAIFFISTTEQPKPDMAIEAAHGYRTALTSPRKGNTHA